MISGFTGSVAASGDDVHVAYSMRSAEGTGVFLAHSMERGAMFHSPISVSYGDRIVDVAVAAEGATVVVAYEEPSGAAGMISLAVSRTQLLEERPQRRDRHDLVRLAVQRQQG